MNYIGVILCVYIFSPLTLAADIPSFREIMREQKRESQAKRALSNKVWVEDRRVSIGTSSSESPVLGFDKMGLYRMVYEIFNVWLIEQHEKTTKEKRILFYNESIGNIPAENIKYIQEG